MRILGRLVAAVMLVVAAVVVAGCAVGGGASCTGPFIDNNPPGSYDHAPIPTVAPGGSFTLYGHWYTTTCNDGGQHRDLVIVGPVEVAVEFADGATDAVGTFSPGEPDAGFTTEVEVPTDAAPGTATVTATDPAFGTSTFEFTVE